ncbi:hypothetical protein F5887DRAFT_926553 [Amanita rubescens]|nr:hypothetical protein F5887DRAFT_926553 [Amanita rubescens]
MFFAYLLLLFLLSTSAAAGPLPPTPLKTARFLRGTKWERWVNIVLYLHTILRRARAVDGPQKKDQITFVGDRSSITEIQVAFAGPDASTGMSTPLRVDLSSPHIKGQESWLSHKWRRIVPSQVPPPQTIQIEWSERDGGFVVMY